jgi:hypothetical protein
MTVKVIDGKKLVFVSILRAGTGILDGMLSVVPGARVGHIGLYRDPKTLMAVEYYFKMPQDMQERDVIVVDPMLATGNSAIAAVERLKELRPKSIKFVCLLTCPEGVRPAEGAPRRADLHRGHRPAAQRARLHPARPGRRRRPDLRHQDKALKAAEARGDIEYKASENVANADYERVMREYATAATS